jgi:hypothetical protein
MAKFEEAMSADQSFSQQKIRQSSSTTFRRSGSSSGSRTAGSTRSSSSSKGHAPRYSIFAMIPLGLALLPATISIFVGESGGQLCTDAVLLAVIGWALWGLSEGAWRFYVNAVKESQRDLYRTSSAVLEKEQLKLGQDADRIDKRRDKKTTFTTIVALFVYLLAPMLGGLVLYNSRKSLFTGTVLVNNFNIFLYVTLEFVRNINRLADSHSIKASSVPRRATSTTAQVLQEEIGQIQRHLVMLGQQVSMLDQQQVELNQRITESEGAVHGELYAVWKKITSSSESDQLRYGKRNSKRSVLNSVPELPETASTECSNRRLSPSPNGRADGIVRESTPIDSLPESVLLDLAVELKGPSRLNGDKTRNSSPKPRSPILPSSPAPVELSEQQWRLGLGTIILLWPVYVPYKSIAMSYRLARFFLRAFLQVLLGGPSPSHIGSTTVSQGW